MMNSLDDDPPDDGPFHLPLLGLYADLELGAGSVHLPDEFDACPAEVRLRILQDWLAALEGARDRAARDLRDAAGG